MELIASFRKLKSYFFPSKKYKEFKKNEILKMEQRRMFYSKIIISNSLCFDVGANYGNRIEPILAAGARVVAIEPQKKCVKFLKKKYKNITVINMGLGESSVPQEFYIADAHTLSTFSKDWLDSVKETRFKKNNWRKKSFMEMTTLDNLINEFGTPCFIKIDVEGYEVQVLKGLSKPIDLICFEYTVPEQIQKAIICIELLEKLGDFECNYIIGDELMFQLNKWVSSIEMKIFINTSDFIKSSSGDIYLRKRLSF